MKRRDEKTHSREALEALMRSVPAPQPPDGLEACLLAAVPGPAEFRPARRPALWRLAAAAAVLLLSIAAGLFVASDYTAWRGGSRRLIRDVSPRNVLCPVIDMRKETDPCDILPPFSV